MDDDALIDPGHPSLASASGLHGVTDEVRRVLDGVLGARISVCLFTGAEAGSPWDDASWRSFEELEALIRLRRPDMVVMTGEGDDEVWSRTATVITADRVIALRCELAFDGDRDRLWRWEPIEPSGDADRVRELLSAGAGVRRPRTREMAEGPYVDLRSPAMIELDALAGLTALASSLEDPAPSARVVHGRAAAETTDFPQGRLEDLAGFIATHEVRRVFAIEEPTGPGYLFDGFGITADLVFGWRFELVRDESQRVVRKLERFRPETSAGALEIQELIRLSRASQAG